MDSRTFLMCLVQAGGVFRVLFITNRQTSVLKSVFEKKKRNLQMWDDPTKTAKNCSRPTWFSATKKDTKVNSGARAL